MTACGGCGHPQTEHVPWCEHVDAVEVFCPCTDYWAAPTAEPAADDDYAALDALAEERRKFQAETLTTSFLAGLLRDGWTRCHRCGIRDGERVYVLGNLREWVCSPCLATTPKLTRERDAAPSQAEWIAEPVSADDWAALDALAAAATPGPWFVYDRGVGYFISVDPDGDHGDTLLSEGMRGGFGSASDAAYVAAASPDVVRRLIADVTGYRDAAANYKASRAAAEHEVARLRERAAHAGCNAAIDRERARTRAEAARADAAEQEVANWEQWSNDLAEMLGPWIVEDDVAQEALITDAVKRVVHGVRHPYGGIAGCERCGFAVEVTP